MANKDEFSFGFGDEEDQEGEAEGEAQGEAQGQAQGQAQGEAQGQAQGQAQGDEDDDDEDEDEDGHREEQQESGEQRTILADIWERTAEEVDRDAAVCKEIIEATVTMMEEEGTEMRNR